MPAPVQPLVTPPGTPPLPGASHAAAPAFYTPVPGVLAGGWQTPPASQVYGYDSHGPLDFAPVEELGTTQELGSSVVLGLGSQPEQLSMTPSPMAAPAIEVAS